jgi:hypothetical protein
MEKSKPKPIEQNFEDIRKVRQNNNNKIVYKSLIEGDLKTFYENINREEYKRTLEDLELAEADFVSNCKDDNLFAKLASRNLSKNASRQCSKDEAEQLRTCNITAEKCGVSIKNLTATELRPTKDGSIVSKDEMKEKGIPKDSCLKSFDAQMSGNISGYIAAKVAYGSGGHQDNVFEEMDTIAEWWKKYKSKTKEFLIILMDTNQTTKFTRIKEKYKDVNNVMIFNHVEFQQYMIRTYYIDESM